MITFETIILGELATNCYLIWEEKSKKALVIDPADDGVSISDEIEVKGLKIEGICLTHGHFDHTLGVVDLKLIYKVPIYASQKEMVLLNRQSETASHFLGRKIVIPNIDKIDKNVDLIEKIGLGDEELEIIKSPGHSPGSVCYYCASQKLLFSGDTLFAGTIGRTDFSYGSKEEMKESLKNILKLPEETIVLPGHGEKTTIGQEKINLANYF